MRIDITVDRETSSITVVPESVTVRIGENSNGPRRACWVISGLRHGDQLHFEDKAKDQPDLLPNLPRTVAAVKPFVNSGNPARTGAWTYNVRVTDALGNTIAFVDPELIIQY